MVAELRRRKPKDLKDGPKSKRPSKSKDVSGIHLSLMCLIVSATLLFIVFGLYIDSWELGIKATDRIAKSLGYHEPIHAIVIDAGSTGSRVLAYTFHKSYLDGRLFLDDELWLESKPGLSSFAKTPEKGAESISKLIDKAKERIPEQYWKDTVLVLKATAGLRLLPTKQADALLDAVRDMFARSPFKIHENPVSIMDGVDEGISSWFTVNFLLNRLAGNADRTIAALDLGGGSTQVTFAPTTPSTLQQTEYIHPVEAIKGKMPVYTHSYLGLGLMAARQAILTHHHHKNETEISSLCVNPFITGKKWEYGGATYIVSGTVEDSRRVDPDPKVNFEECERIITEYVLTKVMPLHELSTKDISAFSYYFERAIENGLVDPYEGGVITVGDYEKTAREVCAHANVDQPFMCVDLTFIWVLLEKGFGLKNGTKLRLYKKLYGHEITWALGVAFQELKHEV